LGVDIVVVEVFVRTIGAKDQVWAQAIIEVSARLAVLEAYCRHAAVRPAPYGRPRCVRRGRAEDNVAAT
jgi:hypothetical protein